MSTGGADVVYTIGADTSQFEESLKRAMSQAQGASDGVATSFRSTTTAMVAAGAAISVGVTAPLVAVGRQALSTSVDFTKLYESTIMVFDRMLGGRDAANGLYADLLKVAKASTFSQETFLVAGKTLVGMGASANQTTRYLQGITDAVSAFGGSGADIEGLAAVFGKVMTQGRLTGETLESLSERGVNALAILADRSGVSADQMRKMISEGSIGAAEALDMLVDGIENGYTDATGKFVQGAEGMAASLKGGTLTGALDSTNSAIRSFSLALVGINPTLKETDEGYRESQERLQQLIAVISTANQIIPKLAGVFSGATDALGGFLSALVGAPEEFDESADAAERTGGALDRLNEALDKGDPAKLKAIGTAIVAVAAAGPGLTAAGAALKAFQKAVDVTKTASDALRKGLKTAGGFASDLQMSMDVARSSVTRMATAETRARIATTGYTVAENAKAAALVVASGATDMAAAAMARLSAAIRDNPVGAALTALTLALPAIIALKKGFDDSVSSIDSVSAASYRQASALAEARDRYQQVVETDGAASESAREAAAAVDAEKAKYDALNMTFGELKQSIESNASASAELHRKVASGFKDAAAAVETYDALLEQNGSVVRDQAVAQEHYNALLERYTEQANKGVVDPVLSKQLQSAQDELGKANALLEQNKADLEAAQDATKQLASRSMDYYRALSQVRSGTVSADEAAQRFALSEDEVAELAAEAEQAVVNQAKACSENKEKLAELAEESDLLSGALERTGVSLDELAAALDSSGMSADEFGKLMEGIASKTQDAFSQMKDETALSMDELITNLAHNADQTQAWGDNMAVIMQRTGMNASSGFMQYLYDLGPEYASQIATIANSSDSELAELVAQWTRAGDASAIAAAEAAGMTVEEYASAIESGQITVNDALSAMDQQNAAAVSDAEAAKGAAQDVGTAIAEGIAMGIGEGQGGVEGAVAGLIAAMQSSMGEAAAAVQPTGLAVAESLASGISAGSGSVTGAMQALSSAVGASAASVDLSPQGSAASASFASGIASGVGASLAAATVLRAAAMAALALSAFEAPMHGLAASSAFASGVSGGSGQAQSAGRAVGVAAVAAMATNSGQAWQIGYQLAAGMASGISSGQYQVVSAASAMAAAATQAARDSLKVQSPSRVFREIGGYVAEGLELGIGDGTGGVVASVADMAARMEAEMGGASLPPMRYAPTPALSGGGAGGAGQSQALLERNARLLEEILGAIPADFTMRVDRRELGRLVAEVSNG